MRLIWLIFVGLVIGMVLLLPRLNRPKATPEASVSGTAGHSSFASLRKGPAVAGSSAGTSSRADSIVAFGLAQQGTPYVYAGTSPLTGFDCSGFIMFTFAHFKVAVPHSTALLIDVGQPVARAEAQPGDIVVFTGTAPTSTTPGHAGIVISGRGEVPLRFVHASSSRREPFVKVSQVEGSDYERRFMQVRRVLGPGAVAAARPRATPPPASRPQAATAVAALQNRPVKAVPVTPSSVALPKALPTKKYTRHPHAKKKAVAKTPARRKAVPKKQVVRKRQTTAKPARSSVGQSITK